MKINFIPTPKFKKSFKRLYKKYPSLTEDFKVFKKQFTENQDIGDDLGGNFRKVRMSISSKNKGKSGGARIIVYNFYLQTLPNDVLLIDIYDKSELSTMQDFEYQKIAEGFEIDKNNFPMASRIITDTIAAGLIKIANPDSQSRKYASYIPHYA